ncbi:MAG: lipoate--protein ligase family protein [Candidatus Binatia bacterium]
MERSAQLAMPVTWRYLEDDGASHSAGLATDEFLMSRPVPTLRLYTYRSHSALVGKFQNVEAEIDLRFCVENGIAVNRRPTGGGAILMGEGQLGIAVVHSSRLPGVPEHPKEIFARFGRSLCAGLARCGIEGSLEAKNDIRVNGRKIAGLGVCRNEDGVFLFHTSLIVDLDVDLMLRVLRIPAEKLSDKLRARVNENLTTVRRETGRAVSIDEAREALRGGFEETEGARFTSCPLDSTELEGVRRLESEKYLRESWVFQRVPTPDMNGTSLRKTPAGLLRLYLSLAGDRIKDVTITGDFISDASAVLSLEKELSSSPADAVSLRRLLAAHAARNGGLAGGIAADDLAAAILEAVGEARRVSGQGGPYGCFVDVQEGGAR